MAEAFGALSRPMVTKRCWKILCAKDTGLPGARAGAIDAGVLSYGQALACCSQIERHVASRAPQGLHEAVYDLFDLSCAL